MQKFSLKDNKIFNDLAIVYYECNSFMEIIDYYESTYNYNEEFWAAWRKYFEAYAAQETLKKMLHIDFVIPLMGKEFQGSWEVNFDNDEITIYDD